MACKRIFKIYNPSGRDYSIEVEPTTTLDMAWASQRCWFTPGAIVTITDDNGTSKTFVNL